MQALNAIHKLLERLSLVAVWIGGGGLLLAAIMVTVDVISRKFLSFTIGGADEYTGYVFAAATTWAYPYVALHRANVRIDALYNFLPMAVRAVLDIVGLVLLLIFISVLVRQSWGVFITSWNQSSVAITPLATPLWIPQAFWLAGLIFFTVTLAFLIIHATTALLKGDAAGVQAIAGTMSVQDEIRDSTKGMGLPG